MKSFSHCHFSRFQRPRLCMYWMCTIPELSKTHFGRKERLRGSERQLAACTGCLLSVLDTSKKQTVRCHQKPSALSRTWALMTTTVTLNVVRLFRIKQHFEQLMTYIDLNTTWKRTTRGLMKLHQIICMTLSVIFLMRLKNMSVLARKSKLLHSIHVKLLHGRTHPPEFEYVKYTIFITLYDDRIVKFNMNRIF